MKPKVRNIDFVYDVDGNVSEVGIRFDSYDSIDGTTLNCSVRIPKDVYDTNATNLNELGNIAMSKLKAKISNMLPSNEEIV